MYAILAGGLGWLAGWIVSFPFELSTAWRYVDGDVHRLPMAMIKGSIVWAAFTTFMALLGFGPFMLPAFLLISPRWIVRRRWLLIPLAPFLAWLAIDEKMGFLHRYRFHHLRPVEEFFFTAPNFFVITFALVAVWIYIALADRRLRATR